MLLRFGIAYTVDALRYTQALGRAQQSRRIFVRILIFLPLQKNPSGRGAKANR
jgi:hypothetical protein